MMSTGLTRKEKEKLVVDLYKQGLTYAQIAKEVHVSLRDIAPILNKTGEYQSLSNSSQAYKMFDEGSTPIQVAIASNLREKEVSDYYREYWNLNGMYYLNQIYEELRDDIWSLIELHSRMKSESLSPQQVPRILKTTMTLEHENRDLECEQARLEVSNKQAAKTFQQLTDSIQKDRKTLEKNHYVISQQKREIENLNIQKTGLEDTINSIQLNNEICIKIKQMVKQEIESFVYNPRKLLRLALASLFESSRKHPGKFQTLYYNMASHLSVEQILAQSSINQISQYRYSENEDEKLLLEEAEQSYNRIIDAITNNCINGMQNETESLYHSPQVLDANDSISSVAGNHKIFDTRNLSQVNFVYNNVTFQLSSNSKITNEKSTCNETDDRLNENEFEQRNFQDQ
jgi:hypothetical protein